MPEQEKQPLLKGQSFANKAKLNKGGESRDAMLSERHKVLIFVRILLAVPGPAFLVFSAIQRFQTLVCVGVVCSVSAWGLSASFTELKTGQNFAVYVLLITAPLWILSLLIAQIEKKPPGSVQEWLEAYRDNQLESFTTSTLEAFCKKEGLKVGGKKEKGDLVKSVKKCLQEKEEQEEEERKKKKEEEERRRKKERKKTKRSPAGRPALG